MTKFIAAFEDFFKSIYELIASIIGFFASVINSILTAIFNFFSGVVNLFTDVIKGAVDVVGGVGKFLLSESPLIPFSDFPHTTHSISNTQEQATLSSSASSPQASSSILAYNRGSLLCPSRRPTRCS